MSEFLILLLACIAAYFVGALPVGFVIARLAGITDIRKHGSGNMGATNVARFLGAPFFFLVLLLDAGKAFFFLVGIHHFIASPEYMHLCAFFVLVGNGYSIFLKGSGGKGVSTTIGLLAYLMPVVLGLLFLIWCVALLMTQNVGAASICAALFFALASFTLKTWHSSCFALLAAFFVLWRHKSNLLEIFKQRQST